MARKAASAKLDTRSARLKLKVRREPYWVRLESGAYLGYRPSRRKGEGAKGGRWSARLRDRSGKQQYQALGLADDVSDADGERVLSFDQAQGKARTWFSESANRKPGSGKRGAYTVEDALTDYVSRLRDEGKSSADDAESRAKALIIPELGSIVAMDLTTEDLRRWRNKLARSPARLRSSKLKDKPNARPAPESDEDKRRRKSTTNRTMTILKAALNLAMTEERVSDDRAWRRLKPFKSVDAARLRFLTVAEAKRQINASRDGFGRLVRGALLTGARYGELRAADVRDFNPDACTLLVARGKGGKPRQIILTKEGCAYFEEITAGRPGNERLFLRDNGSPWGKSHQQRPMVEASKRAKISPPVTFHELRHTYASLSLMAGMSMKVLADNLGHADTRMVEKHYGHLADEYRTKMIRKTAPTYGLARKRKVVRI